MERDSEGASGRFENTGGATEQAKQQGQQFAQQARQQAGELANRGGEQVKSQLETQKHQAAQSITPVQMALRETAQQLRKQGQGPVAQYADSASEQAERFSGYLRETSVDEITDEVRGFARSRPALFLGSAVALGFLGTRFLKSSSQGGTAGGGTGTSISSATVSHGTREPATALPPGTVAGSPTARRTPMAGQPLSEGDRPETPRGF
ncbi:MAG: hypothetical protein M3534_15925 [Actinomycetota bacterium]|nr:hypothetical protein [Actinomycetota bacterium]